MTKMNSCRILSSYDVALTPVSCSQQVMRAVQLRALRCVGGRRGLPLLPLGAAASRPDDSLLTAMTQFSSKATSQAGDSSVEILRGTGLQFFCSSLHCSHQMLALSGRRKGGDYFFRQFSSISERDEMLLEEEAERKAGWLLKLFFIGTAVFVGFQFFPYMGDNLLQQSISLLHVKDPLFKRMGASRLARFAVDDERRMKVVEMGGAGELLNMLKTAKDDKTRKEALKALVALSHSDEAADALHQAGAIPIISSTPNSVEYAEVEACRTGLLNRFQELKYEIPTQIEVDTRLS